MRFPCRAVDSVSRSVANSQSKPTVALHQFSTLVLGMYTQPVKSKSVFVHRHTAGFQWGEINPEKENLALSCKWAEGGAAWEEVNEQGVG